MKIYKNTNRQRLLRNLDIQITARQNIQYIEIRLTMGNIYFKERALSRKLLVILKQIMVKTKVTWERNSSPQVRPKAPYKHGFPAEHSPNLSSLSRQSTRVPFRQVLQYHQNQLLLRTVPGMRILKVIRTIRVLLTSNTAGNMISTGPIKTLTGPTQIPCCPVQQILKTCRITKNKHILELRTLIRGIRKVQRRRHTNLYKDEQESSPLLEYLRIQYRRNLLHQKENASRKVISNLSFPQNYASLKLLQLW